ncbi:hypothetical protein F2Q69_00017293 [Brassica cretica]|uniref:Uncharacterized protein n=1 Tax=Brassica cretica TaxID=69181 RepID=A0A8S9R175_BRACR|nr:hypothetical protein F2Q69_00017293 [Brassica cretica]
MEVIINPLSPGEKSISASAPEWRRVEARTASGGVFSSLICSFFVLLYRGLSHFLCFVRRSASGSRLLGFGRRFLKPLVGLVARGGERVAHPSVLVAVIVWLRLVLEDPIISEASSSPCCQRVSKFVVLTRCLRLHSGVGDSRLWLLRGSVVTSLSTICYLPGFWIQSTVGVSLTCSYRIVLSVVATGEESGGPSGQRISLSLVAQSALSSSSHHSVPVFLHSVLGEGSSSIASLWAASGFVEDCTCGRFLKPLVGLVARGGEWVAHPSVLVAVIVWLRLGSGWEECRNGYVVLPWRLGLTLAVFSLCESSGGSDYLRGEL